MDAHDRLALFADAREALSALSGYKRAILSNGTPAMLDALVKHAGLERQLDAAMKSLAELPQRLS
jgi:2-haloacid dehalogenase